MACLGTLRDPVHCFDFCLDNEARSAWYFSRTANDRSAALRLFVRNLCSDHRFKSKYYGRADGPAFRDASGQNGKRKLISH